MKREPGRQIGFILRKASKTMTALSLLTKSVFAFVILAMVLVAGCRAKPTANAGLSSPLSPVAQEIQRRGYRVQQSLIVPPTVWELSKFRMRSKRLFSFRAEQPMPNSRDYYCRFSLFEETYDSVVDARRRLANLQLASPEGPAEERDYLSTLRTGFRVGNITYVLQTDASVFWNEVQRLAKELATATPGAELTHNIQG